MLPLGGGGRGFRNPGGGPRGGGGLRVIFASFSSAAAGVSTFMLLLLCTGGAFISFSFKKEGAELSSMCEANKCPHVNYNQFLISTNLPFGLFLYR
jgi:hypothetical protein